MTSNQKLQADLAAANVRITELKLDFRAMRAEATRLEAEVMQAAAEVKELLNMNQLLRDQLRGLVAGKEGGGFG